VRVADAEERNSMRFLAVVMSWGSLERAC
jgi:hypothetical protein